MLAWMVAAVLVVSVVKVHVLQLDASHAWYSRFEYTIGGMMFVTLKVRLSPATGMAVTHRPTTHARVCHLTITPRAWRVLRRRGR